MASHYVSWTRESLSFLLSESLLPQSPSDSVCTLYDSCLCIENSSDTATVWPMGETSSAQGLGKKDMAENSFLSPRGFSVLLHSALPPSRCLIIVSKDEHIQRRFINNLHHPKLPNLSPRHLNEKEITSLNLRKESSLSPHPSSDLAWELSLVLTAVSGGLNITMTTQSLRCWSLRPAREALFPRVVALFQG